MRKSSKSCNWVYDQKNLPPTKDAALQYDFQVYTNINILGFSSAYKYIGKYLISKMILIPPHTLTYPLPNSNNPLKLLLYIFYQTSVTLDFQCVILYKILIIVIPNMLVLQFLLWLYRICDFSTELLQEK